jgi:hypothetical protein
MKVVKYVPVVPYLGGHSIALPPLQFASVFQVVIDKVMIHAELAGCRVGHNSCLCKRI